MGVTGRQATQKAKAMRLPRLVIGILAKQDNPRLAKGRELQRVEDVHLWRVDGVALALAVNEPRERLKIRLFKLVANRLQPVLRDVSEHRPRPLRW